MPIDYFANCKTNSSKIEFGLCDNPSPSLNSAYIDENTPTKWIGIVNNSAEKNIQFNAIDNCIDIRKENGKMDSRCDGILSYENNLIFIELKEREGGQWFKKGREQLTATINRFKQEHNITNFTSIKANVCNSLRPNSHSGQFENIQRFKDDTGFNLEGKRKINV